MLDEATVAELANRELGRTLSEAGFDRASVEARPDHLGEDALYVTVRFRLAAPVARGRLMADAMLSLIDALIAQGDVRFPYFIYDYPDDDRPYEADLDAAE